MGQNAGLTQEESAAITAYNRGILSVDTENNVHFLGDYEYDKKKDIVIENFETQRFFVVTRRGVVTKVTLEELTQKYRKRFPSQGMMDVYWLNSGRKLDTTEPTKLVTTSESNDLTDDEKLKVLQNLGGKRSCRRRRKRKQTQSRRHRRRQTSGLRFW